MTTAPERLDSHGRELPVDVAASVLFLRSMGYDDAAMSLRDGWHGPVQEEQHG